MACIIFSVPVCSISAGPFSRIAPRATLLFSDRDHDREFGPFVSGYEVAAAKNGLYGPDRIVAVADCLVAFAKPFRPAIEPADEAGNKDTPDLFTGGARQIDRDLWLVEAHLG